MSRIIVDKGVLMGGLGIVQGACGSRNRLSVLSHVHVKAAHDVLILTAYDMRLAIRSIVEADAPEEIVAVIPLERLLGVLKLLPSGQVLIEIDGTNITISPMVGKAKFKLRSTSEEKFPEVPLDSPLPYFPFPGAELARLIDGTTFAVSDDEARYFMNGCYLAKADRLLMVATDGRRLSCQSSPTLPPEDIPAVIIPPAILEVAKEYASEGEIAMAVTTKVFAVKGPRIEMASTLIDGQFPNYKKVIPEDQPYAFTVKRDDFMLAVKRAGSFSENKSRRTYFDLSPGLVVVRSEGEEGEARDEVEAEYSGERISFAMNYTYLLDVLAHGHEEKVRVEFADAYRAFTFPEGDNLNVIMPMQAD